MTEQADRETVPAWTRGAFADGYNAERVDAVLGAVTAPEVRLVCLWDHVDAFGPGGDSAVFLQWRDRLHYLGANLARWLHRAADDPDAPATVGRPVDWLGGDAGIAVADLPYRRGHNYARHQR